MKQALYIIGVIVLFLLFGAFSERRRHAMLQAWVRRHPGTRLHWGFEPAGHADFPAVILANSALGRAPNRWAGAVETPSAWLLEVETTPRASRTSKWFVLVAQRQSDGTWQTHLEPGLLSKRMLEARPT
jgi:hypothetical protein